LLLFPAAVPLPSRAAGDHRRNGQLSPVAPFGFDTRLRRGEKTA
jgi:hypothetical protein